MLSRRRFSAFRISFEEVWDAPRDGLLSSLGVQEQAFPAVDAEADIRWQSSDIDVREKIGPGSAGCWLAHHNLWKHIGESEDVDSLSLVLEDDSRLTPYGAVFLWWVNWFSRLSGWGLVHLGAYQRKKIGRESLPLGVAIRKIARNFAPPVIHPGFVWRTHAYFISTSTAKALGSRTPDFSIPVDEWLICIAPRLEQRSVFISQSLFSQCGSASEVASRGR